MLWINLGKNTKKKDYEVTMKDFINCPFKGCLTLENGSISKCSRATVAHHIQKFECDDLVGGLLIRKSLTSRKLLDFINNNNPVTACYYCNPVGNKIPAAIQLTIKKWDNLEIQV
jgi:hypothetical protein